MQSHEGTWRRTSFTDSVHGGTCCSSAPPSTFSASRNTLPSTAGCSTEQPDRDEDEHPEAAAQVVVGQTIRAGSSATLTRVAQR